MYTVTFSYLLKLHQCIYALFHYKANSDLQFRFYQVK